MEHYKLNENGAIIIETSIVLPIFMFVILGIFGLLVMFSAQNQITHALIQSSKSLSMDPYITERINSVTEKDVIWSNLGDAAIDIVRVSFNNEYFSSTSDWYTSGSDEQAKKRFIGFFSGGDKEAADESLKSMRVVDGLDGIDFKMKIDGDDMTITIKYEIQFWMDAFGMGVIPMEQSITTKLWK